MSPNIARTDLATVATKLDGRKLDGAESGGKITGLTAAGFDKPPRVADARINAQLGVVAAKAKALPSASDAPVGTVVRDPQVLIREAQVQGGPITPTGRTDRAGRPRPLTVT